jgi:sugar O-acyltransferase (sialic acid O-acetyltransferase NeuD family)
VVYGASAHGLAGVVIEAARAAGDLELVGLVDDDATRGHAILHGVPVLGRCHALPKLCRAHALEALLLGVGGVAGRRAGVEAARAAGLALPPLVHPDAACSPTASVAPGATVLARASISTAARVGADALVNVGVLVQHDVDLGELVTTGPGCVLCGGSRIAAGATLGASVTVLPGRRVGEGATLGAGAVVVEDVPPGVTAIGAPAQPLAAR